MQYVSAPPGLTPAAAAQTNSPFGHAGQRLMDWFFPTRTFVEMSGHESEAVGRGTTGIDDAFAAATNRGIGAEIMGRRKFGPQTGPWDDDGWRGGHRFLADACAHACSLD